MWGSPQVRTQANAEVAEAKNISPKGWHEKASRAFLKLLQRNQIHRVLTIKRDCMPKMFGALTPWSGKPEDMIGIVVQGGVMHFYQLLKYVNKEDGNQTPVVDLDEVRNVNFSRDSPEGLHQDAIDAVRKVAWAKQYKTLFEMDSNGFEELLPSKGKKWKAVITTTTADGNILFHEMTDHVPQVQLPNSE